MRGGASWLPLLLAMIAFLIVVKMVDVLRPKVQRRIMKWQSRQVSFDAGQSGADSPE